jgi:hypothetical protein
MFEEVAPAGWDRPFILRLRTPNTAYDEEKSDREMTEKARELLGKCLDVLVQRREPHYESAYRALRAEVEGLRPSNEFQERMIESASIVFTTCTDRHLDAVSRTEFDWVVIEEAGRLVGCDLVISAIQTNSGRTGKRTSSRLYVTIYKRTSTATVWGRMIGTGWRRIHSDCSAPSTHCTSIWMPSSGNGSLNSTGCTLSSVVWSAMFSTTGN